MLIKSLASSSALALAVGLSVTACGGGGDSTASVCSKIKADGQKESSALSSASSSGSVDTQVQNALKDFAGKLRTDVSNASSSGLKAAGDKFADDLDKLAGETKNKSAVNNDTPMFEKDAGAVQKYCPGLANSSSSSSGGGSSSSTSSSTGTSSSAGTSSSSSSSSSSSAGG
jgi:hypothetical protein